MLDSLELLLLEVSTQLQLVGGTLVRLLFPLKFSRVTSPSFSPFLAHHVHTVHVILLNVAISSHLLSCSHEAPTTS